MTQLLQNDTPLSDNEKLKKILDYLNISFVLFGMDSIFLDANDAFLKMTGARKEKIIGRNMQTILTEEEYAKVKKSMKDLYQGKEWVQYEFFVFAKGHERKIPCLFHASLNKDSAGSPVSVNMLFMSLMEQKKIQKELEKEKKMLEAILFGIKDYVSVFDLQGNHLLGNPSSLKIRSKRKTPFLPLESEGIKELTLEVDGKPHCFLGDMRAIYDNSGNRFAYTETLTDITNKIQLEERELELAHIRRQMRRDNIKTKIVGKSKTMFPVFDAIQRCAEVDSSVLITGETGVGKELVARAIHDQSDRNQKPFVAVNCSALPEGLLESELFGHVKGAFTGAMKDRLGLFREAHRGTLFLDEIGELDKSLQVKLLRVLQEKKIRPVGGDRSFSVDVRIICATNQNIIKRLEQEQFRHDLYYRIAVIPLHIPPLRERQDDIIRLAEYFILKHQKKNRQSLKSLTTSCGKLLSEYQWPGNVRELENTMEYAIVMTRGKKITPDALPKSVIEQETPRTVFSPAPTEVSIQDIRTEKNMAITHATLNALVQHQGDRKKAAADLGISRTTLWRRMKKYNIT